MSLDPSGMERAAKEFRGTLDRALYEGMDATLDAVAARAKGNHGYTDRTGALTNSIQNAGVVGSSTDEIVGTVSFAARSGQFRVGGRSRSRKSRSGIKSGPAQGFLYGIVQEERFHFIGNAIEAEVTNGGFIQDALNSVLRAAGFEVV